MKISTNIKATKEYPKEYILKLLQQTAEEIVAIRIANGHDHIFEVTSVHFGKTNDRDLPCIELSFDKGNRVSQLYFFQTNAELLAFCQGILFTKRGY